MSVLVVLAAVQELGRNSKSVQGNENEAEVLWGWPVLPQLTLGFGTFGYREAVYSSIGVSKMGTGWS